MKEFEVRPQFNAEELVQHQAGAGLTTSPVVPTLDVRGPRQGRGKDIFMSEPGNGEIQQPEIKPKAPKTRGEASVGPDIPASEKSQVNFHEELPHRIQPELAERAWRAHYQAQNIDWDSLSLKERSDIKLAIEDGIIPGREAMEQISKALGKDIAHPENVVKRLGEKVNIVNMANVIDIKKFTDPSLKPIVQELNAEVRSAKKRGLKGPDSSFIDRQIERVQTLLDSGIGVNSDEAVKLLIRLNKWNVDAKMSDEVKETRRYRSHGLPEITKKYSPEDLLKDRKKRDEVFNEIFAGVDAAPNKFWDKAFNIFTRGADLEAFMDLIRNGAVGQFEEYGVKSLTVDEQKRLGEDFQRYQTDEGIRRTLHDVNAVLYLPSVPHKDLFDNMQQFSSAMGDYAFRQAGVVGMMDIYELALQEDMMQHGGYLRPEAVTGYVETEMENGEIVTHVRTGEVELKTKERFRELLAKGKVNMISDKAESVRVNSMEDWEVDRIFTMARGMTIMTERLLSIAAESRLPKNGDFTSLFLQDVIQGYAGHRHLLIKYGVTESGLAAYLYKDKEGTNLRDILGIWSPNQLKKLLDQIKQDRVAFMENFLNNPEDEDIPYLMRLNPNKAGDMFTHLSWRAGEKADAVTMSQRFLNAGRKRMQDRFKAKNGLPIGTDFNVNIPGVDYHKYKPKPEKWFSREDWVTEDDRMAVNAFILTNPGVSFTAGDARINAIRGNFNEYGNWIGTGLRFERMRGDLSNSESKDPEKIENFSNALPKAQHLLKKIAELQPHRLYTVSLKIRDRVNAHLTPVQKEGIEDILSDLHLVERAMLERRESLLELGKTFDDIILDDPSSPYLDFFNVIIDPTRRQNARDLAQLVKDDFTNNEAMYKQEFINRREYSHGFVLWSGDAPLNEFNASALGPTGGFARRARDNGYQAAAAGEEIKLLASLGHVNSQDQIVAGCKAIYDQIANYDADKAKQIIADKAEGIIKFYAADWESQIPILGTILGKMRRSSFAQVVSGKSAMVWQPGEARAFLVQLKDAQMITEDQFNRLKGKGFANNFAVSRDVGVAMAQIMAIAFALYMFEELNKQEKR